MEDDSKIGQPGEDILETLEARVQKVARLRHEADTLEAETHRLLAEAIHADLENDDPETQIRYYLPEDVDLHGRRKQ